MAGLLVGTSKEPSNLYLLCTQILDGGTSNTRGGDGGFMEFDDRSVGATSLSSGDTATLALALKKIEVRWDGQGKKWYRFVSSKNNVTNCPILSMFIGFEENKQGQKTSTK